MKIIITSKSDSIESEMDLRFGRAAWLAVYDTENGSLQFVENEGASAQSGAGPKVAEKVANLGAVKVFSGDFGPKATTALQSMGIEMVVLKDEPVLKDLIKQIK
ncbi:MAG TPA: NifB/NifX family molybdenum-iron cluster-binding protein [Bacteroidales bacterium]|nr:NifB/NifX family molybdenum-iron cluster-binding protein [Bacteroidales bacterium]